MLWHNDICFQKELFASFKLAQDRKENTIYFFSKCPLFEGLSSTLDNSESNVNTRFVHMRIYCYTIVSVRHRE